MDQCLIQFFVLLKFSEVSGPLLFKILRTLLYGTLVRYAFFAKVRVRYVGMLYELKTPGFSRIAPAFCMQRQKTAETEAKYVN